jgi:hypothetical protein
MHFCSLQDKRGHLREVFRATDKTGSGSKKSAFHGRFLREALKLRGFVNGF